MSEKVFGNWEERGLMNISCALLCDLWGKRRGGRKENVLLWVIKQSFGVVQCCLDVGATDELWVWKCFTIMPRRGGRWAGEGELGRRWDLSEG